MKKYLILLILLFTGCEDTMLTNLYIEEDLYSIHCFDTDNLNSKNVSSYFNQENKLLRIYPSIKNYNENIFYDIFTTDYDYEINKIKNKLIKYLDESNLRAYSNQVYINGFKIKRICVYTNDEGIIELENEKIKHV